MENPTHQIGLFLEQQLGSWPMARQNYLGLSKVLVKSVMFDGFEVKVQFNPERIRSSAANVDAKAISERPCFLCGHHLPPEQMRQPWGNGYQLLVNPFPIFGQHLTVPSLSHTPQSIEGRMGDMLALAADLPDFTVFYNGAACGASAPNHFHFQAGAKGLMPIEADFKQSEKCGWLGKMGDVDIFQWKGYLRGTVTLVSNGREELVRAFTRLSGQLQTRCPNLPEPMLNLLAYIDNGQWVLHVFPRIRHRPDCFFAQGNGQILISPASVDMGGFLVVPRREDFEKMDAQRIEQIYGEVCMDDVDVSGLCRKLIDA
ncbi:MAG: DUF4922 domain-containing protein [Breznakibacter sp.]